MFSFQDIEVLLDNCNNFVYETKQIHPSGHKLPVLGSHEKNAISLGSVKHYNE